MTDQDNASPTGSIEFDEHWTDVLVAGQAPREFGDATVRRLGDTVPEPARLPLARAVAGFAERAQRGGAVQAAIMLPEPPFDGIVAYAECRLFDPVTTGIGATVKAAYRALSTGSAGLPDSWRVTTGLGPAANTPAELAVAPVTTLEWQDVDEARLPAGPAVRVHDLDTQPSPVESITHIVPHEGVGIAVMMSWSRLFGMRFFGGGVQPHPYDSEAPDSSRGLALHADSLAETLRIAWPGNRREVAR